jgi:hypothetical protein
VPPASVNAVARADICAAKRIQAHVRERARGSPPDGSAASVPDSAASVPVPSGSAAGSASVPALATSAAPSTDEAEAASPSDSCAAAEAESSLLLPGTLPATTRGKGGNGQSSAGEAVGTTGIGNGNNYNNKAGGARAGGVRADARAGGDITFPISPGVRRPGNRFGALKGGKGAWMRVRATHRAASVHSAIRRRLDSWRGAAVALCQMRWRDALSRAVAKGRDVLIGRQFGEIRSALSGGPVGHPEQYGGTSSRVRPHPHANPDPS